MENQKNERIMVFEDESDSKKGRNGTNESTASSQRNNFMAQYEAAQKH